jgi:hypothetical protein
VSGFEATIQIANAISASFYLGLGSLLIYRAARLRYGALASSLTIAVVILSTNLLHYGSVEGSFSHVYGFCILSGVVYLTLWRVESRQAPPISAFILFGFLMGLAVMVRPTNAVYALLFPVFIRGASARRLVVGSATAFFASAVAASPQMLLWYVTTGRFIYYSYVGEGFHFLSPELFNYLFSIRKGVFFWHPVYLLMVIALLQQFARRRFDATAALLVVISSLYLGSSWGDYTFGDSFGSRQSVELLPVLIVPLAAAISGLLSSRWRWAAGTATVALVALNTVLYDGYINDKLPHNNANRASYADFWANTFEYDRHVK